MPLTMTCNDLEPGMKLAEPVLCKGRLMLPAGKALTAADIAAVTRRFPWMSFRVGDPILDEAIEFEDDSKDREVANVVQSKISHCMSEVHKRHSMRISVGGGGIDFELANAAVKEVMKFLTENPVSSALLSKCFDASDYLAVHAGNVFYLSMLLGSATQGYVARERKRQTLAKLQPKQLEDLTPLGVGAMFSDIGLAPLAPLFGEDRQLTDSERQIVRDHPAEGAKLMPDWFPPLTKMVVRTHHENYDGTGYPGMVGGEALNVFTRILRIADAFDSATSNAFSQAKSPIRVLWELSVGPYRHLYDPVLMIVFRRIIQPFPIGAKLRLTDGRSAVVTRYNREAPFDPAVIVAFDKTGERITNLAAPAPLSEQSLTAKSFQGEDLGYLQYGPGDEPLSPPAKFRTLFEAFYP